MKAIRYFTSILFIAAGVGHIFLFRQEPMAAGPATAVLVFGIIYIVIGILLFLKVKYSEILGIIFPLIGSIVGFAVFDPTDGPVLLKIMGIANLVNIIFCAILLWYSRKKTE